jgi:2-oxoglutarate ferredoxin oxidoreductase subunit delta
MTKILVDQEKCKGCYYCINACKQNALCVSDKINKKGFRVVQVNDDMCIACGSCYEVCPDLVFEIDD